jgi:pilus assembly protein CpaF
MNGQRHHPSNGFGLSAPPVPPNGDGEPVDPLAAVKKHLHDALMVRVAGRGVESLHPAARRLLIREEALAVLREEGHLLPQEALARVVNEVSDRVVGLGPIESLLRDPEVSEVMVNGADDVYVERKGRLERVGRGLFEGEEAVLHVIERIVAPLGLRVDESSPWVDARLPDGSRVHALIPPLSLCGPVLNIRKFSLIPFAASDLVADGSLGPRMLEFLAACVRGKANVVISGGTSSGKTTLLNVLASFIPDAERLITIEDAAELRLGKPHVVRLEARPPNVEGRGEVTVRQLVRNALRMRPDRIIVGEVRGAEALDMLQALNTGHEGSLSTAHANSPHHLLWRLETMALMSDVDLPAQHIREQVAAAVDVVVHMARLRDGRRLALHVSVVEGCRDGEPVVREAFSFRPRAGSGSDGEFVATGVVPELTDVLAERGEALPARLFVEGPDRLGPVPDPGPAPRFEHVVIRDGGLE